MHHKYVGSWRAAQSKLFPEIGPCKIHTDVRAIVCAKEMPATWAQMLGISSPPEIKEGVITPPGGW